MVLPALYKELLLNGFVDALQSSYAALLCCALRVHPHEIREFFLEFNQKLGFMKTLLNLFELTTQLLVFRNNRISYDHTCSSLAIAPQEPLISW